MKLRLLSEIQYKETSTNLQRANANGVRVQNSINDLYHNNPKPNKKKLPPKPDNANS